MVRLIKKYEEKEYRTESKQVGTLYHVCTLNAFANRIIEDKGLGTKDNLHSSGKYYNNLLKTDKAVSFTRDPLFVVPTWTVDDADILFQFVIDGDKLSEHYKITPYQALDWTKNRSTWSEKEEVVKGPIKNFKSYIKEVHFDIKSLSPTTLSRKKASLKKVKKYLGSIKCTRTTLPYHSGDNKHSYKKSKNEFDLYKIKTLDDLIQYIENLKNITLSDYSNTLVDTIDSRELFGKYIEDLSEDQLITLLKKYPKWINIKDKNGYTPLYNACFNDKTKLAKFLIEQWADINIKDKDGKTPLYLACYYNNTELAKLLLEYGADVNSKNESGITPLFWSCSKNNTELVKLLIEHGADVNSKNEYGYTLLHLACSKNNTELVKLFIEHGADINSKDKVGETPLLWTCKNNNTELAKLLLEYGADVDSKNNYGETPLYWTCNNNYTELVKLLIEYGADVNFKDRDRYTPLFWSCSKNNTELVKFLIEHGADVNSKNKYGDTPLSKACYRNNTELVKLLLDHGAWKDLDANNLPEYITNNKEIEELVLSYLNKNKRRNESIKVRRLYRKYL